MPALYSYRVTQERETTVQATSYEEALEKATYAFDQYGNNYAESGQAGAAVVKVNNINISRD